MELFVAGKLDMASSPPAINNIIWIPEYGTVGLINRI
jgi:hypothetical protein